jgi:hypothetical protein
MSDERSNFEEIKKVFEEIKAKNEQMVNEFYRILKVLDTQKIAESIEKLKENIGEIKKTYETRLKEVSDYLKEIIKIKNTERFKLNSLIVKWFIPAITGTTLIIFFLSFLLWDKSKHSIVLPISILAIGAISIISLVIALAIINKSED